ncbi:DUF4440 domain-containing protein [Pseudactinotalea sp. HY158]|uniref:DUF4440 domain-containing protein n=1 Tax=Pseudactinotalea sp. HY158 TaxID=2654547 RepID=UPI00129D041C|nr:DUF4440 domain-containing protein [Pseudactinotalea sp. HY158]QGH69006.1 DUF4440 domain-containing protein [Pseudactinotalea sp. HY158]
MTASRHESIPPALEVPALEAEAIGSTLMTVLTAFSTGTAAGISAHYTADADWTNAFGTRLSGGAAVEDYLVGLFANERFAAGELAGPPEVSIQALADGVAVAHIVTVIEGQQVHDGSQLGTRTTNSLHILLRQESGDWKIATQIFADARTETTHVA